MGSMAGTERRLASVSLQELERRWALVREHLRASGLDALVVQDSRDFTAGYVRWLTGAPAQYPRTVMFHASDLMTVIEHGPAGGHRRLDGQAPDALGVGEVITTAAFQSTHYTQRDDAAAVADVVRRRGYRRVGFAGAAEMPHGFVGHLTEALSGTVELSDEADAIDRIKAIKSPEEIAWIRETAKVQDLIFSKVLQRIEPGMRDFEVMALAQYEALMLSSEDGVFLGSSAPPGQPAPFASKHMQGRTLHPGDYMSLLIENNGPGGMYTELARTIVLGAAPLQLRDGFELVKEAQARTVRQLKPGASPREIFASHNEFMTQHGAAAEARLHAHGQGCALVERPLVRPDETMLLERGMNVAVHPGYATATMFVVICDNYLIEDNGAGECLHQTPKRVFELA